MAALALNSTGGNCKKSDEHRADHNKQIKQISCRGEEGVEWGAGTVVARLPKSRSHFHVLVDLDHYVRRYEPSDWSKQRAQRAGHVLASKGPTTIYTTTLNSYTQNSGDSVIPSQRRRKEVG